MKKRILAWFLIGSMIVGIGSGGMQIQAQTMPEVALDSDEIEIRYLREKGEPSKYGYQDYEWVDADGNVISEEETLMNINTYMDPIVESAVLPSSYDMRNVDGENLLPAIRNQKSFGTCWAHAALASVETNMIKKGYADSDVNYSERHLAYFSHTKNVALGDGKNSVSSGYGKYGGGNAQQATGSLAGWYGAANEEDFPYEGCSATDIIDESYRSTSVAHLTASNRLKEASDIKKAVMGAGAVQASYYATDADGKYVYRTGNTQTNHAISIVGWDDNIDKSNFSYNGSTPANNGAWLCRNSWGSNWGDNGYFWMSYEEGSLCDFWSYEAEPASMHEYIYQYDGAGYGAIAMEYRQAANAFTASSDQILQQIGFYTWQSDTYKIEVFLGKEEVFAKDETYYTFPKTASATVTGQVEYGGYHTVDLEEELFLEEGQRFLVVVTLDSRAFPVEFGTDYTIGKNQSYFRAGTYGTEVLWQDALDNTYEFGNVCIKAITDDAPEVVARKLVTENMELTFSAEEIGSKTALESMLPNEISVITDVKTEETAEVDVVWTTEDDFVAAGGTYHYTGTLQSDEAVYVPKSLRTVSIEVTVEPVVVDKPEFTPVSIPLQEDKTEAGIRDLGIEVFPESGKIAVGKAGEVEYTIQWDEAQKIDLSNPEAVVVFEGTVSYIEPEDWMTLPDNQTVTRTVTVEEPEKYQITLPVGAGFEAVSETGYRAEKVYEGRSYKFKLNEKEGYDLSSVLVKVDGVEVSAEDGIYTIENVVQNIADITVENVQLKNTFYKKERTSDNRMKITPIAPAVAVKLAGEEEYQPSLIVSGQEDEEIVLRDAEGNESTIATVGALEDLVLVALMTQISQNKVVSADKMYSLAELKNACLPEKVVFSTVEGIEWEMSVVWNTKDIYDVKGGRYHFTGTLVDDGVCSNWEDIQLECTIQVDPVSISTPVFMEEAVEMQKGIVATASQLGTEVFPVKGKIKVNDEVTINYQIGWDQTQTIDLGSAGERVTFYGEISYSDVPQWLTLPDSNRVSRVITVLDCTHANKEIRNKKDAAEGVAGYTGDIYCMDCEELIASGRIIEAIKIPVKTPVKEPVKMPEVGAVYQYKNLKYAITSNKTVAFTGITDNAKTVKIPETVEINEISYKVTEIQKNAFKNNKKITSITIGKNITTIGENAFYNCTALKKIVIPDNVKKIGAKAFYGCKKLESVTIGKSVNSIGKEAFRNCSKLATIKIKSTKLKTVGKNALKGMKSTGKITVPAKKLSAYKKLLKGKGQSKKVKIKK